jgi:hypothetical protein
LACVVHLPLSHDIPNGISYEFDRTNETPWAEVAQGVTRSYPKKGVGRESGASVGN